MNTPHRRGACSCRPGSTSLPSAWRTCPALGPGLACPGWVPSAPADALTPTPPPLLSSACTRPSACPLAPAVAPLACLGGHPLPPGLVLSVSACALQPLAAPRCPGVFLLAPRRGRVAPRCHCLQPRPPAYLYPLGRLPPRGTRPPAPRPGRPSKASPTPGAPRAPAQPPGGRHTPLHVPSCYSMQPSRIHQHPQGTPGHSQPQAATPRTNNTKNQETTKPQTQENTKPPKHQTHHTNPTPTPPGRAPPNNQGLGTQDKPRHHRPHKERRTDGGHEGADAGITNPTHGGSAGRKVNTSDYSVGWVFGCCFAGGGWWFVFWGFWCVFS